MSDTRNAILGKLLSGGFVLAVCVVIVWQGLFLITRNHDREAVQFVIDLIEKHLDDLAADLNSRAPYSPASGGKLHFDGHTLRKIDHFEIVRIITGESADDADAEPMLLVHLTATWSDGKVKLTDEGGERSADWIAKLRRYLAGENVPVTTQ